MFTIQNGFQIIELFITCTVKYAKDNTELVELKRSSAGAEAHFVPTFSDLLAHSPDPSTPPLKLTL